MSGLWSFLQRYVVPPLKKLGTVLGDWLATVGWGKFVLLSLLALAIAGIVDGIMHEQAAVVVERSVPHDDVKVDVKITDDGIRISPSVEKTPAAPKRPVTVPPSAPKAPVPPKAPDDVVVSKPKGAVQIDEKGIRISSDRDGKKVQVIIDGTGVLVEEAKSPSILEELPPAVVTAPDGSFVISLKALEDPALRADALESVRDQIESIVEAQVDHQVAREVRHYRAKGGDWLVSFVVALILAAITFKIVLGGKKRAERRAQIASATAEESLKRQLAEAHLKMMQAQVEPHFLFNTLASVDYLIETDPPTASKMQKNLIQYVRAALPQMREGSTTLGKEIQQCRAYLEILKFRMEDRLQYAVTVPQGLMSAQFPPMMLQSLVENSIKHGLQPKPEGGSITLTADIASGKLRVTVADTGLGFAAASTTGTDAGLANVRERLAALHGIAARLTVEANTPHGTIVTIEVPYTCRGGCSRSAVTDSGQQLTPTIAPHGHGDHCR